MKTPINKERLALYVRLGGAFLVLNLFGDLITYPETFLKRAWNSVWLFSYITVINFIFFEYTLPFIKLTWKRILAAPLLLGVHLFLYSAGLYGWRYIGIQLDIYFSLKTYTSFTNGVSAHFGIGIFSAFFFGIIKYTYDYRKLKEATQQLRIEKQEAELAYLKSQTNPHFLFNTLNNIYSLARDKSDLAPESILRLSQLLRFMLYETSGDYIAIEQEIKIMDDYIALEKLRYDDSLRVDFKYDIDDMKQALPPLLLIPLVENAFKHGVSETRNHPFVTIHLSVTKRQLAFVIKNSTEDFAGERVVNENIGLSNLRRQLELLYTDYRLSVQQSEAAFTATLTINLASHA